MRGGRNLFATVDSFPNRRLLTIQSTDTAPKILNDFKKAASKPLSYLFLQTLEALETPPDVFTVLAI